jgi:hypothetical protein
VPVLARVVEASGIATVLVTMMPDLGERFQLPRIVGVEFPFGHPFGIPHDRAMERTVAETALALYERQDLPARADVPIRWPVEWKVAYKGWQPKEPAPIIKYLKEAILRRRRTERE